MTLGDPLSKQSLILFALFACALVAAISWRALTSEPTPDEAAKAVSRAMTFTEPKEGTQ